MKNLSSNKKIKLQLGLTLVELMVAMVIGLVLTGGVIQIFVANNQTYRVTDNMSRLQENGRFALDILGKTIRLAGFKGDTAATALFLTTPYVTPAVTFTDTESVFGTDGGVSGANTLDPSDSIYVRYRGATNINMADCVGTNVGQGSIYVGVGIANRFFIADLDGDGITSLYCHSSAGNVTQPLIDNVASMQILYGMTDDPTSNSPNCYLPASTPIVINPVLATNCTTLNFNQVVSVRIKLLLTTQDDNLTSGGAAQTITFDDNGAADTMGDRRIYRTMTQTISLRNKNL